MAQIGSKVVGLAVTYFVFEYTTKACEKPLAHIVSELQRRSLVDIIADMVSYLEDAGLSMMMRTPKKSKGVLPEPQTKRKAKTSKPKTKRSKSPTKNRSPKPQAPVIELCERCLDTHNTVEMLRKVAADMQLPYPGEDVQPCSLCKDRAHRLHDLEMQSVLLSPSKGHSASRSVY
mmetsp:Transcript_20782/g.40385  ORF Transcript_20782/g.40385 Transcript_20782/m.40385 type:complete len:175 (+) Transcript_20782:347-871(+)